MSPVSRRRVLFIANPRARGLAAGKRLDGAVRAVAAESGLDARLVWTQRPGEAGDLAREAWADGVDLIFACGGDGTLNEVLNGLDGVPAEAGPAVGIVPGGTANVWAREAGIPRRSPAAAIRAQIDAAPVRVDLGRVQFGAGEEAPAGGRRFLLMVSLGFDAAAVASVSPALKRRLGQLAYIWAGLRTAWRDRGFDIESGVGRGRAAADARVDAGGGEHAQLRRDRPYHGAGVGRRWGVGLRGLPGPRAVERRAHAAAAAGCGGISVRGACCSAARDGGASRRPRAGCCRTYNSTARWGWGHRRDRSR